METEILWEIDWLECKVQEGNYTDVVVNAGWLCCGKNEYYRGYEYGVATFPLPAETFTPYNQLTKEQVLNWCWENGVNKIQAEQSVVEQVQNKINFDMVQLPVPWMP